MGESARCFVSTLRSATYVRLMVTLRQGHKAQRGGAMRYTAIVGLLCVLLMGCGATAATVTPAPTPTVDVRPTQPRAAEISQLATLSAPTATPLPTNTPIPPTPMAAPTTTAIPTRIPTAASTPTAVVQKWNNLPIPADAVFSQNLTDKSVAYTVFEDELAVSAFMKREWIAVGLIPKGSTTTQNLVFYDFAYPTELTHFVSYAVQGRGNAASTLVLLDSKGR